MEGSIVVLTGGTGLIGQVLTDGLLSAGYRVRILTRSPRAGTDRLSYFKWNIADQYIDPAVWDDVDILISLVGAGIVDRRWTEAYKAQLYESRVTAHGLLAEQLHQSGHRLTQLIGASAIGYYGDRPATERLTESSTRGVGFISSLCDSWERSYDLFSDRVDRTAIMRLGLVLTEQGGFLESLTSTLGLRIVPRLGDGSQVLSWVHYADVLGFIHRAIARESQGVYNLTAPNPVTGSEFIHAISQSLGKKILSPPVPEFLLRGLMGQRAEVILQSNRVLPDRLMHEEYPFNYPHLIPALKNLLD